MFVMSLFSHFRVSSSIRQADKIKMHVPYRLDLCTGYWNRVKISHLKSSFLFDYRHVKCGGTLRVATRKK